MYILVYACVCVICLMYVYYVCIYIYSGYHNVMKNS